MRVAKHPRTGAGSKGLRAILPVLEAEPARIRDAARAVGSNKAPSGLQVNDELEPSWLAIGRFAGFAIFPEAEGERGGSRGRGLAGALAKGGGERARLAEPDVECDFR